LGFWWNGLGEGRKKITWQGSSVWTLDVTGNALTFEIHRIIKIFKLCKNEAESNLSELRYLKDGITEILCEKHEITYHILANFLNISERILVWDYGLCRLGQST
jgi:hypothetical protein